MPRAWTRPGGTAWLSIALVLAGGILAGCAPSLPGGPPLPGPAPALPAGPSLAAQCGPKPPGAEQPPDAWVRFDVTPQQWEVIGSRLREVLCRQGLWRQGVGFGANVEPQGTRFVMIHPGRSGLTARQILDRFLGRGP
jgi:hypothetical protein